MSHDHADEAGPSNYPGSGYTDDGPNYYPRRQARVDNFAGLSELDQPDYHNGRRLHCESFAEKFDLYADLVVPDDERRENERDRRLEKMGEPDQLDDVDQAENENDS